MGVKSVPIGNGTHGSTGAIYPGTVQNIATSASNAQSAAFGSTSKLVRLHATQDVYVLFGSNPVATASTGFLLKAGFTEHFGVTPGEKLGVLRVSADGILSVCEAVMV